jgi:predicted patatin/cPLA2 family phospholipase
MSKIGLVLEGGGLRAAYTSGVLSWFIDHKIDFDFVVGISSGALLAAPFVIHDKKTLKELVVDHAGKKENIGLIPLFREGNIVGYNYLIDEIINKELQVSAKAVRNASTPFEMGIYDLYASETLWMTNKELDDDWKFIQAACTLPIVGRAVKINNRRYLDAGLTSMIPIKRSLKFGCEKHVVVTTKTKDFVRKPNSFGLQLLLDIIYFRYPKMRREFRERTGVYYKEKAQVEALEAQGKAIFLRPSKDLGVKRFSGDIDQLQRLYDLAYQDMDDQKDMIYAFMEKE